MTHPNNDELRSEIKKLMESFAGDAVKASKTYRGFRYGTQIDEVRALFNIALTAQRQQILNAVPLKQDDRPEIEHWLKSKDYTKGFNEAIDQVRTIITNLESEG